MATVKGLGEHDECCKAADISLSKRMWAKWKDASWLMNYDARNSWALDFIFWRHLDCLSYGDSERGHHHARLDLLDHDDLATMVSFVRLKMEHLGTRELVAAEGRDDASVAMVSTIRTCNTDGDTYE